MQLNPVPTQSYHGSILCLQLPQQPTTTNSLKTLSRVATHYIKSYQGVSTQGPFRAVKLPWAILQWWTHALSLCLHPQNTQQQEQTLI